MNMTKRLVLICAALLLSSFSASSQYKFLFRGTSYETNASGNIVATPITEQTLLADGAAAKGITDLRTVALVYRVGGDEKGDTVEILYVSNWQRALFEYGL